MSRPATPVERARRWVALGWLVLVAAGSAAAQWVEFADESSARLSGSSSTLRDDVSEKDYAWGDVDHDGDIDLVVVRKEPFTTPGKRTNVLLLNEFGVLTDRTFQYATDSDVPGDQGFLTPTNDRDVALVDVDGDGWLDIVTAVTISDGDPKTIGHPRVYMNLGLVGGLWQGFRYEQARIPEMSSYDGGTGFNPRFCSVAAGDVTGDGYPDLWFGDYDSAGVGSGTPQPEGADFNDRLLVNDGTGHFTDETATRFGGDVPGIQAPFEVSAFGAAGAIVDLDLDGLPDILKQTSLNSPLYVGVAYNTPGNAGNFDTYDVLYQQSPYFVSVGDLNNDARPDIVITDDGQDRYLLNQDGGSGQLPNWQSLAFSYDDGGGDDGFGANSVIADLDRDGWNDVLIADVDTDIPGCGRRLHIYRNFSGLPGGTVTLAEQTTGTGCTQPGQPDCFVGGIPTAELRGIHDVAVFDVNSDGWLDLVLGRCDGTRVWINQPPPPGLRFSFPEGLPFLVPPGTPQTITFHVEGISGGLPQPGTAHAFASVAGAAFAELPIVSLGGFTYEATLPAAACTESIAFYFSHEERNSGVVFTDPPDAPADSYVASASYGTRRLADESFESPLQGWTVVDDPSLTGGSWERVVPVGTLDGTGQQAAPAEDAEAATDKVTAMVTGNGSPGGPAADSDVDGGPTDLISPAYDLSGTDGFVSYSRWFFGNGADQLTVAVSADDGATWTTVDSVGGTANQWTVSSFRVGDHVVPGAGVRVRFRVSDEAPDSLTEAAVDLFRVDALSCTPCAGDVECDDGVYCNGPEVCDAGQCGPGATPCAGQVCDEATDSCVACVVDAHCDDGAFCNGVDSCVDGQCVVAPEPCPGSLCSELLESCVECLSDADCSDGVFCNGIERCELGSCGPAAEPCPGLTCDEAADLCLGDVALQPRPGQPLLGLTPEQRTRFDAGRAAFDRVMGAPDGLGPIFNQNSCGSCHSSPLGGSGSITVTRFGTTDESTGAFDPLEGLGGSLMQAQALSPECAEIVPPEANVIAHRLTNSTLGGGLVEALADADLEAAEIAPPGQVSGRVHWVEAFEQPGLVRAGRFGWKAQLPTVLSFSADAALNEMGITNRLVSAENAPNGDLALLAQCDPTPDREDGPDGEGFDFIDRVSDFQRLLAPPPQTPRNAMTGEVHFNLIGCAACHTPAFTTPDDPQLEPQLRNRLIKPYSDFLLHDMGQNADFIGQGDAEPRELRTPPLWGLRLRDPLWHDGRVAGGTLDERVTGAIALHDALGSEAQFAASNYASASSGVKSAILRFLGSLGRIEFDQDGDGDVDIADMVDFVACYDSTGTVSPEMPCAVADVDQDGAVDDNDYDLLGAAGLEFGGRVPDGALTAGQPLRIDPAGGGDLLLTWDASCRGGDFDYAVYEGPLGQYTTRHSVVCSTAGATDATIAPASGSSYYLVVPHNGIAEGSYGVDSSGAERSPVVGFACHPQQVSACD